MSNGRGSGQWFNDRRFTFNGPQRLRENVSQMLNDLNQQVAQENPELLNQLADQFQRLQDVLHGRRLSPAAPATLNNSNNVLDSLSSLASSSGSQQRQEAVAAGPLRVNGGSRSVSSGSQQQPSSSVVVNIEFDGAASSNGNNHPEMDHRSAPNDNTAQANNVDEENRRSEDEPSFEQEIETVRQSPEWQRLMQATRNPDIQKCLNFALIVMPFLFIILLKVIFVHIGDLFRFAFLVGTFFYAERVVYKQVSAKKDRSKIMLLWIGFAVSFVLFYFGYYYSDNFLHLTFSFQMPIFLSYEKPMEVSLFTVLWVVLCTDFAAKHFVLLTKCILALIPLSLITIRRKTSWYQWIEFSSHMYRHWLPVPIWWAYLRIAPEDSYVQYAVGNILAFCYVVLKISAFRSKFRSWFLSTRLILRPVPFGSSPKTTDLMQAGPTCSICYADFVSPVQLNCKHIFCEECVSTWLDKERTCPICRAEIGTADRSWRDGSTSYIFQFC